MKKTVVVVIVSLIAAILVGWGIAKYRITHPPYNPAELVKCITPSVQIESNVPATNGAASANGQTVPAAVGLDELQTLPHPIISVERLHNFGILQNGEKGEHDFIIKNSGDANLTLSIDETSCKCTAAVLEDGVVKPGMSEIIKVTWKTADFMGDYVQKVLVKTNDPEMSLVELEVRGKIVADARAVPSEISFASLPFRKNAMAETQIACYKNPPLKITQASILNSDVKDYFDIKIENLTEEEYYKEPDATAGYRISVIAKETLPLGPFKETLIIKTDSPLQPEINVPVYGTVVGNLSIAGQGWSSETKTWILGYLDKGVEGKKMLLLLDRSAKPEDTANLKPGELPPHIDLQVESVEPEWLQVKLDNPAYLGESGIVRTQLFLTIPADAPVCDYWGLVPEKMAKIILKTSSQEQKSILIYVRFVVTNK